MLAFVIRSLLALQALLPLKLAHAIGAATGTLFQYFPHNYATALKINLSMCFPELNQEQQQRLIHKIYPELGKTVWETGAIMSWSPERLRRKIVAVEGKELMDQALQAGRGVIIGLPHLGSWEILSVYLPTICKLTALYRPIQLPALDRYVWQSRERAGTKLVPTDNSGIRQLVQGLKRNETIVILPDQDPRLEGQVFAPFFGVQASTATLLPRLAHKTKAAVLFCYGERLPNAAGYKIHFRPADPDIADADLTVAASAMNRGIEACIREIPEQYQWTYKRFKTRPPGEEKIY